MRCDGEVLEYFLNGVQGGKYLSFSQTIARDLGGALVLLPGDRMPDPLFETVVGPLEMEVVGRLRVPKGPFRGIVREGCVVSWAAAGEAGDGVRFITVETARKYRGQGLAGQCLRALCHDVSGPLIYLCGPKNTSSLRAAMKAGFELLGHVMLKGEDA